jgi:hypothetical protein
MIGPLDSWLCLLRSAPAIKHSVQEAATLKARQDVPVVEQRPFFVELGSTPVLRHCRIDCARIEIAIRQGRRRRV